MKVRISSKDFSLPRDARMHANSHRSLVKISSSINGLPDGTVYCVGRNYAEHIKELPGLLDIPDSLPSSPMIFLKSPATIRHNESDLILPSWSNDVHHEVELAVQLDERMQPGMAAVSIDLTARDVQASLKRQGHPWTLSKSFIGASPFGSVFSLAGIDLGDLDLELKVNGIVRQSSSTSKMIFKVPELIAYLKGYFPLQPGDWIMTGTPEGVASLKEGDSVVAVARQGQKVLSGGGWMVKVAPPPEPWKSNP